MWAIAVSITNHHGGQRESFCSSIFPRQREVYGVRRTGNEIINGPLFA